MKAISHETAMARKPKGRNSNSASAQRATQASVASLPRVSWDPWIFGMLASSLILHLVWLGRASLQIDEIVTIRDALSQPSVAAIYATELERFHWYRVLPLFMVPIHWIGQFFPGATFPPEWALRLPGALFSALSLPLFYGLGQAIGGRRLARVTMALAVFSPFHLYYAREAYAYGYLMAFSAGVLWSSCVLLSHDWSVGTPWKAAIGFMVSSTLMLQTHLTGVVFLSVWLVVMAGLFLWKLGLHGVFRLRVLGTLLPSVIVPYLVFSPFLVRLLAAGYSSTDTSGVICFSGGALISIFGRMGWGEAWWDLIPFLAALIAGAAAIWNAADVASRPAVAGFIIQPAAYIAFQGTYQYLTKSRFEVRYFSSAFPILMVLAAAGLLSLWGIRTGSSGVIRRPSVVPRGVALTATAILAAWLAFGDALVLALGCRGHNYRAMARWINDHVPDGGIYAYDNVWDLRGVPGVYPTPGRVGTSVAAWTTLEDVNDVHLPERVNSLFQRFPELFFAEVGPADLLHPEAKMPPIDRDALFMRHEWVGDAAMDWLFGLDLHPLTEVLWGNRSLHRTLFSYNLPEDLPALARRNGRSTYHSFGSGWQYVRDQNWNHWMVATGSAEIIAGNANPDTLEADLLFTLLPQPPGCRVEVTTPSGSLAGTFEVPAPSPSGGNDLVTHRIAGQALTPGTTGYRLTVKQLTSDGPQPMAALHAFEVKPATPSSRSR